MEACPSNLTELLCPAITIAEGDEIKVKGEWLEVNIAKRTDCGMLFVCATDVGVDRQFVMEPSHHHRTRKPK